MRIYSKSSRPVKGSRKTKGFEGKRSSRAIGRSVWRTAERAEKSAWCDELLMINNIYTFGYIIFGGVFIWKQQRRKVI